MNFDYLASSGSRSGCGLVLSEEVPTLLLLELSTVWGWTEEAATGVAAWSELKALVSFVLVVCLLQEEQRGKPVWFIFGSSSVSSDLHTNKERNLPINH